MIDPCYSCGGISCFCPVFTSTPSRIVLLRDNEALRTDAELLEAEIAKSDAENEKLREKIARTLKLVDRYLNCFDDGCGDWDDNGTKIFVCEDCCSSLASAGAVLRAQ